MAGLGRARRAAAVTATVASVATLGAGCTGGPAPSAHPAATAAVPQQSAAAVPQQSTAASAAPAVLPAGPRRTALATRYLAIAKAGNARLEVEFDRLHEQDRSHLGAAHRDLREVATTERRFDRGLLSIAFPAAAERTAQFLYWVNQTRASMTMAAASSRSLTELHADEKQLTAANVPVEQAVATLRRQLGLPPPESS